MRPAKIFLCVISAFTVCIGLSIVACVGQHPMPHRDAVLPKNEGGGILFEDDFESWNPGGWESHDGWRIEEEGGNTFLRNTSGGMLAPRLDSMLSDFSLSFRFRIVKGAFVLEYRKRYLNGQDTGYVVEILPESIVLSKRGSGVRAREKADMRKGDWHVFEVKGSGEAVSILLDDKAILSYKDPDPIYSGYAGITPHDNPSVDIDDFRIMSLAAPSDLWQSAGGPEGSPMNAVLCISDQPETLVAGGPGGGVFRSTNAGDSWSLVRIRDMRMSSNVVKIVQDPKTPSTLYLLADTGVWKSADGGISWRSIDLSERDCMIVPDQIAIDSTTGELWLRIDRICRGNCTRFLYDSKDGLETWTKIELAIDNPREGRSTALAVSGRNVYLGWDRQPEGEKRIGTLYGSRDGGKSWKAIDTGKPADTHIYSIYADSRRPSEVWVGISSNFNKALERTLLVSYDAGANWKWTKASPCRGETVVHGKFGNELYVSSKVSKDDGATWEAFFTAGPGIYGQPGCIAIDPTDRNTMYVALNFGPGIAKTVDGGRTWMRINRGIANTGISLIAPDPREPGTLYASAVRGEGTFKTADCGKSWTWLNAGGITHAFTDELAVEPSNPDIVWDIADVGQAFRSENGGTSWEKMIDPRIDGGGFRYGSVYALAASETDPAVIYALKNGFGIFRSDDAGRSWSFLHQSEVDYTYSLIVHPSNPKVVYCGYVPKPFQDFAMVRKSVDGGENWMTALSVKGSAGITSLAFDPRDPKTVYAGSIGKEGGKLYRTVDEGNIWKEVNPSFTMCTVWGQPQLVTDPNAPDVAYAATWLAGTWKTVDAGASWTLLARAPVSATSLCLDPEDGRRIFASDRTKPVVWFSDDAGETWSLFADFSGSGAFLVNRVFAERGTVYAATFGPGLHGGRLYKSQGDSRAWKDITGDLPRSVLDIAADPSDGERLYVTTHIHGAYVSTDGGSSWNEMKGFPDIGAYDIEADPATSGLLYACGLGACTVPDWCMGGKAYAFKDSAGVYRSTDGGNTWSRILETSNECRAIRIHPRNRDVLFAAAMDDGLLVSADSGRTWKKTNGGLDTTVLTSCAVAGGRIYAGTQGCGVYGGDFDLAGKNVAWQKARANKPRPRAFDVRVKADPAIRGRIYVSANPGGLFRSDDGGKTFYDKNFLTPSVVADDPARQGYYPYSISSLDSREVWIGTWGRGVFKSYDGMDFNVPASGTGPLASGKYVYEVLADRSKKGTAYIATESGVYRTVDGGVMWTDMSAGIEGLQVRTLVQKSNGVLVCGTLGNELYEYDAGVSKWRQLQAFDNFGVFWPIWNNRPLYQYTSILFHPKNPDIIYMGTFPAGIYRSDDGGKTWKEKNIGWTNDGVFTLVFHPNDPRIIYAGTYNGVNRTTDGGEHWELWDEGFPAEQWVYSIDFDPSNPSIMYACSKNGENEGQGRPGFNGTVMKSEDGGAHWFAITNGLRLGQEFYKIIVDPVNPRILYLATGDEGVFISPDAGSSWRAWNDGLANPVAGTNGNNVTNTMCLSSDGARLFFGTAGSGVWMRNTKRMDDPPALSGSHPGIDQGGATWSPPWSRISPSTTAPGAGES